MKEEILIDEVLMKAYMKVDELYTEMYDIGVEHNGRNGNDVHTESQEDGDICNREQESELRQQQFGGLPHQTPSACPPQKDETHNNAHCIFC